MKTSDTATLLSWCSAFDSRSIGETDVLAWSQAIDDWPLKQAQQAVSDFYRKTQERRIMPADINARVREIRREAVKGTDVSFPHSEWFPKEIPGELDRDYTKREIIAKRAYIKAVADGDPEPPVPKMIDGWSSEELLGRLRELAR